MRINQKIHCKLSGLTIGNLEIETTAGAMPYLVQWSAGIAYHPVFSLETERLLTFAKQEWERLAKAAADTEVQESESQTLQVAYLAILHRLDSIKQDIPALPPLDIVSATMGRLFKLAYWKWHLESERFVFPTFHISKYNNNANFSNIGDYLNLCFDVRHDYESNVREFAEQAKLKAAERALLALKDEWLQPVSKRLLWQWVLPHIPDKWKPDAQGWLKTLFLGGGNAIIAFDKEEIDLADEIITASCPYDSGVMPAVRNRINSIRSTWAQHYEAFEIELADYAPTAGLFVNGVAVSAPHPGPEPTMADCGLVRSKFYIAHARWTIAKAAYIKNGGIL